MQKQLKALVDAILRAKQQHKRWVNVVTGLMAVVVFVTTYALILPAVTMTADAKELVCPVEVHQHTSECYDGTGALICGQADYIVHTHDSECYDPDGRLICTMPEVEEHIHSEDCYSKILTCTDEELTGHVHDDSCYTQRLNCGYPEEEHTHSAECYDEDGELSCGLEEHTHVDECYVSILSCNQSEEEGHTHDESCFASVLTCGKNQIEIHSHGTDCYETIKAEDGTEQKVLTCDKLVVYRHQHGDGCFQAATAEEEPAESAEPEETAAPDETVEPEASVAPEESAEPTETAAPEENAEPEETAAPEDETEKTEVTSKLKAAVMKAAASATAKQWTDDISWYLEDGTLYIEGTGDMPDVSAYGTPWNSYRSSIKKVVIGEGITRIGNYNFYYLTKCDSAELPSTIKSIGDFAFSNCYTSSSYGITSINLPEGLEKIGERAFYNDRRLGDVELPSSLKEIGPYAFYNCNKANIILSDTPITVGAYTFYNCNNLQGTAVLAEGMTQVPSNVFYKCTNLSGVVIPSTVTEICAQAFYNNTALTDVTMSENVTAIGDNAFYMCSSISKLELPTTLKSIGQSGFNGCTALSEIDPKALEGLTSLGSYAFQNCKSLAIDLVISKDLTEVPSYAFSGCSSLKSVTLPEGIKTIGTYAFYNCKALTGIDLPDSITEINNYAFEGDTGITQVTLPKNLEVFSGFGNTGITEIELPSTVTTIGSGALYNTKVSEINIPAGVTFIGEDALRSTEISEITLPEGLKTIGNSAFRDTLLTELDIPDSVSSIGSYFITDTKITRIKLPSSLKTISSYMLSGTNLENVEIPDSVTAIEDYAFYNSKITSITVPDSVTTIGGSAFNKCVNLETAQLSKNLTSLGASAFYDCNMLKSVNLPEGISSIGSSTFYNCYELRNVNIPKGVTSIGDYAFYNCSRMTSAKLPEALTKIGYCAFYRTGIKELSIPSTVTSLGNYAFAYCNDLKDITIEGTWDENTTINQTIFRSDYGINSLTINAANMKTLKGCFDSKAIRGNIIVGEDVETLYKDTLFYLLSKREDDSVGLKFEGPHSFNYSGATAQDNEDAGYYDINFIEGSYYADENGVLYRLNEDKTATLVYCPEDLALEDYSSLLKSFTTEDGTSYNVTAIDSYAFEGNTGITSIVIPSNISSIGKGAFYNCTKLAQVNGETSLESVETALGSTGFESSSFWNTALLGSETVNGKDDEVSYDINTSSIVLEKKEADNSYKLKVSYKYSNLIDGTENQQLTGYNTFISISLDDTYSGVKDHLRVYFKVDSDCSLRNKSNGTILGYKQDTEIKFTTSSGESVSCYFKVADEEKGLYYVDLGSIKQGDTLTMDFSCNYPNWTGGGTVTAWIDNSEGATEPDEVLQAEWVTTPDDYTVSLGKGTISLATDGTDDGNIYVKNLYGYIAINDKTQSYGTNPLDSAEVKYWLDLPEGFYWNEKIIDAIKNDRINIYRNSNGYYYLEADLEGDGNYTTFGLVRGNDSEDPRLIADLKVSLDENDNIILNWVENNVNSSSKISDRYLYVYFNYPNVIMADRDILEEETASGTVSKNFVYNVEVNGKYRYSNDEAARSKTLSSTLKVSGGTYKLYKSYVSNDSKKYMGGCVHFQLTVKNQTIFSTYYDEVMDALNEGSMYYYVKAADMEKMLKESDGEYLYFNISNARICTDDSRSSTTTVLDINGNSVLTDAQQVGVDASHSGRVSTDNCVEDTCSIMVRWNDDYSLIEVEITGSEGNTDTYTVGEGGDYDSVEAAFADIGIQIQYETTYYVIWKYPEQYKLKCESEKVYDIYASVKDSSMALESDGLEIYDTSTGTQANPNYAYIYTGTDRTSIYSNSTPYIYMNDYSIYKMGRTNGQTITESTELKVGDVISYTNYVTNVHTVEGLPMVDKMSGAQLLLAPVEDNPELADRNLPTVTDNGIEYYKLTEGTYSNVKVALYANGEEEARTVVADSVTVTGTSSGFDTLIYWYITLDTIHSYASNSYSGSNTHKFTYKSIVELNGNNQSSGINFPVNNEVWLGDHQSHRLYDRVGYYSVLLSVDKRIVTNAETPISADHDSSKDSLATTSNIKAGETVTYRLEVKVIADKEVNSQTMDVPGSAMFDELPKTMNKYWSKDNVTVTYVAKDGSVFTPSDSSADAWRISNITTSTDGISQQRIVWNSDFKLTVQGTGYIYVTLKYPDKDSDEWSKLTTTLGATTLYNKWQVGSAYAEVEHVLAVETTALLEKGVFGTGFEFRDTYNSYYSVSYTNRENGREYYGNNVALNSSSYNQGSVAVYYVALYNEGNTRLYMNDIQDVLPKGYTFEGLMSGTSAIRSISSTSTSSDSKSNYNYSNNGSGSYKYFKTMTVDYSQDLTPSSSYYAIGTFMPSVETLSDGRQRVTIKLVKNDSSTSNTFGYDSDLDKYYLKPGQATVIMYCCKIGDASKTEDLAVNSVSMPFEDYNGGGINLDDTKVITTNYFTTAGTTYRPSSKLVNQTPNDGTIELLSKEEASSLGMNVGKTNYDQWLTSQVTLNKGIIKPGITKSCTVSQALSTDTLTWNVEVTGGDEGNLHNYTITDTMMEPYKFTGIGSYTIDVDASTVNLYSPYNLTYQNLTLTFDIPEVGKQNTYKYTNNDYSYTVRLDEDEDTGTQTLTIKFVGSYYDVPIGLKGKLTVRTNNTSSKYENKDYINTAYLTPSEAFDRIDVSAGTYTEYDPALDNSAEALPSVTAEGRVAVSYGYATTSYITVTELNDTSNNGASNSENNKIALGSTESTFRYEMKVNNSGGVNSPATAMSLFVLVDNLPEVGDHQTFYNKFGRYSEFKVDFADNEEDLDLQVYVTDSSGNVKVLDSSQYEVMFTKQTSFEYNDNKDVWKGEDLSDDENWFTLAECLADGTLSDMRSLRVVLKDENANSDDSSVEKLIPAKSVVTVAFNAKIDEDSDPDFNQVAYNSFGYLYMVNNGQLQSSTASVGVKTPGVPYIVKKLVGTSGEAYKARQDESFQVIIYKGESQGFDAGLSADEIFEKLDALNIDATMVTLNVAQGKTASETLELSNLKCYVYDEDSKSWVPGDNYFTWDDGEKYTARELPIDDDSEFEFSSINASQKNSYSFGFLSASPNTVTITNKKESGAIKLTKVSDRDGAVLSKALFGLYTTNKEDALDEDETLTDIDKAEREIKVDDTTWYLKDLQHSDENGLIQWSGLMEDQYYVLELEAPESYAIGDEPGQAVDIEFGTTKEITVTNYWSYNLPHTGGTGTLQYTLAGTALTLASAGALLYLKKKKEEQG
jgi:LPXTG-motif cell wall-anchored protein